MTTTGFVDSFGRTVSGGFGTATSGQAYTLAGGTAAQYSVAPGIGSIAVNTGNANWLAYVDRQTADIDISGQVALSAVPANNLSTAGFTAKQTGSTNYYIGSLMVSSLSVMSLRISKVIAGGLVTLNSTLVPGLGTYSAGTYFNIRFQCYWSNPLQANVLSMKIWPVGGTEPGGWLVSITDNAITQYASGTQAGFHVRDESTTPGNTGRFQNVSSRSYSLPMPALTDPMCYDPGVSYPRQPVLESLATAADAQVVTNDPLVSLAQSFPRVRISSTNVAMQLNGPDLTFTTVEYNVGTPTDLGFDGQAIYLPVGIWLCTFEIMLAEAASTSGSMSTTDSAGPASGTVRAGLRSNAAQSLDSATGGCGHMSATTYSTDPLNPLRYVVSAGFGNSLTYTVKYMALSAMKISDYFA